MDLQAVVEVQGKQTFDETILSVHDALDVMDVRK